MNRRTLLTGTISSLPIVATGCLSVGNSDDEWEGCTGEWSPGVEADEPTLAPGDETTVHVAVENATGLQLQVPLHDDDLEMGPFPLSTKHSRCDRSNGTVTDFHLTPDRPGSPWRTEGIQFRLPTTAHLPGSETTRSESPRP